MAKRKDLGLESSRAVCSLHGMLGLCTLCYAELEAPPSDAKIKTAAGKVPLDLVPLDALKGAARVFEYGAKKYAPGNWWLAEPEFCPRYVGAQLRHLSDLQMLDGTYNLKSLATIDPESGLPNVDHLLTTLLIVRSLLIKHGALPADPGPGKEPPK